MNEKLQEKKEEFYLVKLTSGKEYVLPEEKDYDNILAALRQGHRIFTIRFPRATVNLILDKVEEVVFKSEEEEIFNETL